MASNERKDDYKDEEEVKIVDVNFIDEDEEDEIPKAKKPKVNKKKRSEKKEEKIPEEEELSEEEEELVDEAMGEVQDTKKEDVKLSAIDMLVKFKNFISSDDFDKKVEKVSRRYSISKSVVKNKFIRGFLGTIADVLNLTIAITGDIIVCAIKFINTIIKNIINFAASTLHKLINLLTLNCGTVVL